MYDSIRRLIQRYKETLETQDHTLHSVYETLSYKKAVQYFEVQSRIKESKIIHSLSINHHTEALLL